MTSTTTTPAASTRNRRIGADLHQVTSVDEALRVADLDWGLEIHAAKNLSMLTDDGVISTSIPGARMVMRDDNHVTLGVVGSRYQTVDNRSVFGMAEHFIAQGAVMAEGGTRDHGRQAFMRLDLPGTNVELAGGQDLVHFGVLIRANHGGTGNVSAEIEATRLACTNGMTARIKGIPHLFKVRHTASAETRIAESKAVLQGTMRYAKEFASVAQHMLDTPMSKREFGSYIDALFPKPDQDEGRAHTMWTNRRASLMDLFQFADTNELVRGTAWSGFNAITEYLDWKAPVRVTKGHGTEDQVRAERQMDATNQDAKDRALALLS